MAINPQYILDLAQTYKEDEDLVGKKVRSLGSLCALGIPLPRGFVLTTDFFTEFLRLTGIDDEIKRVQALDHPALSGSRQKLFAPVKKRIMQAQIPRGLATQLHGFYKRLSGVFKEKPINIFSSSLNNKSVIFTNVLGDANLILKIKTIWSETFENPVAIVVQENIKGKINGKIVTDIPSFDKSLTVNQINKLISYCKIIQKHFYFPYEIEYMIKDNKILVTQIFPFTGKADHAINFVNKIRKALIKGTSINPGIVTGKVKIMNTGSNNIEVKKEEIIVLPNINHLLFAKIKNAKAVVIDSPFSSPLEKTLYRMNFHVPTVENARNACKVFKNGNVITVNGVNGEIYLGGLLY